LNDPDEGVRLTAASSLSRLNAPETILPLVETLKDPLVTVRYAATLALSKAGKQAVAPLTYLIDETDDFRVKVSALRVLGRIKDPSSLGTALKALEDRDWSVRAYAALALAEMENPSALEDLETTLAYETHPFAKMNIEKALIILRMKASNP